ncbi:hypothetical protein IW261DRAFT_1428399 [Armillaria novae-zelandiae]|uniref:Secreted protein n=1 Tax=Armillaria novae-zelandiae TaxID=153914 RepID=A0AA39N9J0_9AGAR|nr:hypothetical protein IW261DRAFT_1428399 [Armillaria novae-zelandiae]
MARLLLSAACLLFFCSRHPTSYTHDVPQLFNQHKFVRGCTLSEYVVDIACAKHLWNSSIVVSQGDSDPCSLTMCAIRPTAFHCAFLAHMGVQSMPAHMGVENTLLGGTDIVDDSSRVQWLQQSKPSCGGCGAHLFLAHDTVVSSLDNIDINNVFASAFKYWFHDHTIHTCV